MSAPAILFVDDEPNVTENLRLTLRKTPYCVYTAGSGREALEILRSHRIDVVVSDEKMPRMSGSEFLSQVALEFPDTTRIILSGQASLDSAIRAINDASIFRFLTKPCSPEDVLACLEAALAARMQRAEARPNAGDVTVEEAQDFERALESLWMAFQPVVRPRQRKIFAFEALVRSHHPAYPNPMVLFDTAERIGRIDDLEQRIRERVAEAATRLPDGVSLLVNLHPHSFGDSDLFSGIDPLLPYSDRVVLEITERAPLDEIVDVREKVQELRRLGFRIAIDDLGAGYAGLSSFAILQPEIVKFDMSLVRDIQHSRTKAKLIESMVQLSKELGFETISEGVETEPEYRQLQEIGCELFQGYYLARPAKAFPAVVWPEEASG